MISDGDVELSVTEIQRFCMRDGPGIRTTVFLKGCPLRCAWCHNPETQSRKKQLLFFEKKCIGCRACSAACENGVHSFGERHFLDREKCVACGACADVCPSSALEICGRTMTVREIVREIKKDSAFYGEKGGMTISGGEPFFSPEGLTALLRECRKEKVSTAVDTCGFFPGDLLGETVPLTDLFLWDLKDTDPARHKRYTGAELSPIIDNLRLADSLGAKIRLRCILVNGVNTEERHYEAVRRIASSLHNLAGIDVIPYHAYSGAKSTYLGLPDSGRTEWIPSEKETEKARKIIGAK